MSARGDRGDSRARAGSIADNIDSVELGVIAELERDLRPHELLSLVFLLYEEPHVAAQRAGLLRSCAPGSAPAPGAPPAHMNPLLDWAQAQAAAPAARWRYELLEALSVCQLYSNIRKLGFDVAEVKKHFLPGNALVSVYVHPMKKVLYNICEGLTADKFENMKSSLETFDVHVTSDNAEMIFLELICNGFLSLGFKENKYNNLQHQTCDVSNLADILKALKCNEYYEDLKDTQNRINNTSKQNNDCKASSSRSQNEVRSLECDFDLNEINDMCTKLLHDEERSTPTKMKTDSKTLPDGAYKINDPFNVGICYIVNQVNFYPSKKSIDLKIEPLDSRHGSNKDRDLLKTTFTNFGYTVVVHENLKHHDIQDKLKQVIAEQVTEDHSSFVLCVLSHGMKGAIFGVDSVPVRVVDIQDCLNGNHAPNLLGKPKIMLVQACQGTESVQVLRKLVPDGPTEIHRSIPVKADIVTYWATVPGHLSYRDEQEGTVFIQVLCKVLKKFSHREHLMEIFTRVNSIIMGLKIQVPNIDYCTLRKKIYLINQNNL